MTAMPHTDRLSIGDIDVWLADATSAPSDSHISLLEDHAAFWFDLNRSFPVVRFSERCPDPGRGWQFRDYPVCLHNKT